MSGERGSPFSNGFTQQSLAVIENAVFAGIILHHLKSWAIRLAGRRGFRKAAVATARKIAELMLTVWKNGTDFQWTKEATA